MDRKVENSFSLRAEAQEQASLKGCCTSLVVEIIFAWKPAMSCPCGTLCMNPGVLSLHVLEVVKFFWLAMPSKLCTVC